MNDCGIRTDRERHDWTVEQRRRDHQNEGDPPCRYLIQAGEDAGQAYPCRICDLLAAYDFIKGLAEAYENDHECLRPGEPPYNCLACKIAVVSQLEEKYRNKVQELSEVERHRVLQAEDALNEFATLNAQLHENLTGVLNRLDPLYVFRWAYTIGVRDGRSWKKTNENSSASSTS